MTPQNAVVRPDAAYQISLRSLMNHLGVLAILFTALRMVGFREWQLVILFVAIFYCLLGLYRCGTSVRVLLFGFLFGTAAEFISLIWVGSLEISVGAPAPLQLFFPFTYYVIGTEVISPEGRLFADGTSDFTLSSVLSVGFLSPMVTGLFFALLSMVSWAFLRRPRFGEFATGIARNSAITASCIIMSFFLFGFHWLRETYFAHPAFLSCILLVTVSAPFVFRMISLPRFQLSDGQLLVLQFALAPLFLARAYADVIHSTPYNSQAHQFEPIRSFVWFVVPAVVYVVVLVTIRLRRCRPSSFVFFGIRCGICFGILFLLLSFGPYGIPVVVQDARESLFVTAFLMASYGVLGAAAGVTVSLLSPYFSLSAKAPLDPLVKTKQQLRV